MKMTIKTGDNVLVLTGKDKGKTGKVTDVNAKENKVVVDGVNVVVKHQKPRSQQDKGGIVRKTAPIDASNVLVVCTVCGKATRVSHKEIDGKKVRFCKKCSASLDKEFVKATKKDAKKTIKASELKNAKLKAADKPAEEKKTTKARAEKVAEPAEKKATKTTKAATKTTKTAKEPAKTTKTAAKTTTKTATKPAAEKKTTTTKKSTAKKEEK